MDFTNIMKELEIHEKEIHEYEYERLQDERKRMRMEEAELVKHDIEEMLRLEYEDKFAQLAVETARLIQNNQKKP